MQKYLPYLLSITLIWGCKDDDLEHRTAKQRNAFLQKNEIGIYNGDNPIVLFQSDLHQLAYTSNGKSWRIQTDNQQQYLSCRLNENAVPGKNLTAIIHTKDIEDITEGTYTAVALKTTDEKCWLWLPDLNTGLIIQYKN